VSVEVVSHEQWPPIVAIQCNGCHRRVAGDLTSPELRRLVSWADEDGGDWCLLCQGRRHGTNVLAVSRAG
jgi:hypothetical protein